MQVEGKLHVKFDTQNVSDKFQKRDFVIEVSDNPLYPQYVSFQFTQDKCNLLDKFNKGDKIKLEFNLRGREYTTKEGEIKYFNTLEAWKIDKTEPENVIEKLSQQGHLPTDNLDADQLDWP